MAIKFTLSLVIAAGAFAAGAVSSAEADLPPITMVSIQVQPLTAVSSPGRTLFFTVHCEGVSGVGTQTPLSIAGAPEGTSLEVSALTEHDALLGLAFPSTAAKGRYTLSVKVGSPTPLVEQEITIEIGE